MAEAWYYSAGGAKQGPIDTAELKRLAGIGTIKPETLIWKSGLKEWVRADRVRGLFVAPSEQPPPLPVTSVSAGQVSAATPFPGYVPSAAMPMDELNRAPIPQSSPAPPSQLGTGPSVGAPTVQDKKPTPTWVWVVIGAVAFLILKSLMSGQQAGPQDPYEQQRQYNQQLSRDLQQARDAFRPYGE